MNSVLIENMSVMQKKLFNLRYMYNGKGHFCGRGAGMDFA